MVAAGVLVLAVSTLLAGFAPMSVAGLSSGTMAVASAGGCDVLLKAFPQGVARSPAAARAATRAGYLRPFVDAGAYRRNARLDWNANGVACDQEAGPAAAKVRWSEPDWCASRQSLADLRAGYDPGNPRPTLLEVARRRYPPAISAIGAQSDDDLRTWLRQPGGSPATFSQMLATFDVITHEGGHFLDFSLASSPFVNAYRISEDGDVIEVQQIAAYPRAEILKVHPAPQQDTYAPVYLTGPSGGQDIEMLVEEFVQYVHSLASAACAYDVPANITLSHRDGVLTMMWWIELYLQVGREQHPDAYQQILANRELVQVILRTWDRAEYWLARTRGTRLGDADAALAQRVYATDTLAEIARLRERA